MGCKVHSLGHAKFAMKCCVLEHSLATYSSDGSGSAAKAVQVAACGIRFVTLRCYVTSKLLSLRVGSFIGTFQIAGD